MTKRDVIWEQEIWDQESLFGRSCEILECDDEVDTSWVEHKDDAIFRAVIVSSDGDDGLRITVLQEADVTAEDKAAIIKTIEELDSSLLECECDDEEVCESQ